MPPRLNPNVKIIQIDLNAEEFNNNIRGVVSLNGCIRETV